MENENVIIQKFLQCGNDKIDILLKLIIQSQHRKMIDDLNKVLSSMKKSYGRNSPKSIQMAKNAVIAIYNEELSYINIIWDHDKSWWNEEANTRFNDDFKIRFENCLKEKQLQTVEDWWCRTHILKFKEYIMLL